MPNAAQCPIVPLAYSHFQLLGEIDALKSVVCIQVDLTFH